MLRRIFGLLVVNLSVLALVSSGDAQEKDAKHLKELISSFPTSGRMFEAKKEPTDAAVVELLKDVHGSIVGLVELLQPGDPKGADNQARMALHELIIRAGGDKDKAIREKAAKALVSTLSAERPKEIQGAIIRELQFVADEKQAAAIGKFLLDADLTADATNTLVAIKTGAGEQFRAALPKAKGKERLLIINGLGTIKDKKSAESLRNFLTDEDRDTRLTAAWALASLPDAKAADRLLKLADGAKGYERSNLTISCFLLAENLVKAGDKTGAHHIYNRLHETRTDEKERYVKEAAAKGLKATAN